MEQKNRMKIKNVNLEWNVLRWDFNSKKACKYNVMHNDFPERIAKAIRSPKGSYRHIDNKEDLKEWLKRELMYYYWCKSECEYVIGGLFNHEEKDLQKLDIWFQLEMNLDRIVDYVMKEMNISFKE